MTSIKVDSKDIGNDLDVVRVYQRLPGTGAWSDFEFSARVAVITELRGLARKFTAAFGIATLGCALAREPRQNTAFALFCED